jgi:hypothetical protein
MMGGVGMPQQSPGGVMGPDGLPVGGAMPGDGDDMGGSDLLSALGMSSGDPYDQPAGTNGLSGLSESPEGDQGGLMQLLALMGLGVNPADAQDGTMKPPGMGMGGMPSPGMGY